MIPQILELKNFLSYGEQIQRIDFKDYSLICLSGKNGHGKSALLDAITWAVWGQARKIAGASKADDGLLRLGQTGMMVSLEFLFAHRTYRVRREYAKPYGKPYAALDFEIFDNENNRFVSLTDKTIRATQAKIESLIGLDYETFINSAFIRQGQSNEFSKKSSKERKHILGNILGLSKYDGLQQQALEKVKNITDTRKVIIALKEQFLKDLSHQPELTTRLDEEKKQLAVQISQLEALQKSIKGEEKKLTALVAHKTALLALRNEQDTLKTRYTQGIDALKNHVLEWKKIHVFLLSGPNLASLQKEKELLKIEEKQLVELQQASIVLQEKILLAKDSYQKQYALIKNELDLVINNNRLSLQKAELAYQHHQALIAQKTLQHKDLLNNIITLQNEKAALEKQNAGFKLFEQQFKATKHQFEKRRAFYQILVQRGNWTKTELVELENKQKTIHDNDNPACPLCEQLLTIKRKQFLGQQLSKNESSIRQRLHRISTVLKKLKELLVLQHEEMQSLIKEAERYKHSELALVELDKKIKKCLDDINASAAEQEKMMHSEKVLSQESIVLQKALEALISSQEETLSGNPATQKLHQTIQQLEQEKASKTFNTATYQQVQQRLHDIDNVITQLHSVQQAAILQQERRQNIRTQCLTLKQTKKIILSNEEQLKSYDDCEKQEQLVTTLISSNNQALMQCTADKEKLLHSIGSLEYECNRLQKIDADLAIKNEQLKKFDAEIEDYQIIATALSKNGIQALLIEEAIPEIEHEANTILAKLTDNQAQIFIESLRDLKSGGVKETLDIQIADTAGIRPYEMYSGGEAFRVDFALRIAIAKLLARRAGTALQTLIIDEGFGSQDEEGLAHIMDSLYAVQDDFSKIIIVSHLQEFKHNFPVHFIIEKSTSGSAIRVEERG